MSNLWGRLMCAMFGHRRGKRIQGDPLGDPRTKIICPRCGIVKKVKP